MYEKMCWSITEKDGKKCVGIIISSFLDPQIDRKANKLLKRLTNFLMHGIEVLFQ